MKGLTYVLNFPLFSDQDERSRDEVPLHRWCPVQALPIQDVLREGLGLQVSLDS